MKHYFITIALIMSSCNKSLIPPKVAKTPHKMTLHGDTRVERQQRRPQRRAFSNQREDGSVVRGVGGGIEQIDAGAVRQGGRQGLDDLGAPPLTDVGNRFYQAHTADIT